MDEWHYFHLHGYPAGVRVLETLFINITPLLCDTRCRIYTITFLVHLVKHTAQADMKVSVPEEDIS